MIAKPGWFGRRKYLGWGFWPKTWQAWVYIVAVVGVVFLLQSLPYAETHQLEIVIAQAAVVAFFSVDVFRTFRQDERETIHEAFAERNAMWAMVTVLAIGVAFQAAQAAVTNDLSKIDPVIGIAIAAALIVKTVSNLYLDRKD